MVNTNDLANATKIISNKIGILSHISKLPLLNTDPKLVGYGIWPADTLQLGAGKYGGRSSGTGYVWQDGLISTIGETVERYCPAFYKKEDNMLSSYQNLGKPAIHPNEYALYHEKQYEIFKKNKISIVPFQEDTEIYWTECIDLTQNGAESWVPSICVYMPWDLDPHHIILNTSTGLAAHTDIHKAILAALFEIIERDTFVTTWAHKLPMKKIVINNEIRDFLKQSFPDHYEFHFVDITHDLGVPTVFGICFAEAEFGKFVAVGASTRSTMGEALQKTILEIGQGVSYQRHTLGEHKNWEPDDNFNKLRNFELHSIFYSKRHDLWHAFDPWRNAEPVREIDLFEKDDRSDDEKIKDILTSFKEKSISVLFKDLTTVDVQQAGFYAIKVYAPQLIQMAGGFPFYFLGGRRLYENPTHFGYPKKDYAELNKFPHPFP
ncbi:MAG: YcaO-like family protein [Bacteroidota bacterium]